MTKRDQGPHYIPELDPENENRPQPLGQPFLLSSVISGTVALIVACVIWLLGSQTVAIVVMIVGVLLLIPFWISL